ncbi:hypothetical protein FisN_34Hu041 [Fistulifera solaris]|uniref:Glycosyltransferase 61 catalytic domain-containing protein n=1 Tax=Fistulifera solaris TaxID=1519565 RepID=A0A1Z5JBP6_FISSO|nr:hypothetical protein FisN_34Hu041 [Fistulifera solaris]|eukprot:GAX11238.1 hypothetical protein FisN_34Hu041 [Fistulifera solaris]
MTLSGVLKEPAQCLEIEPGNFDRRAKSNQSAFPPKTSESERAICKFMNSSFTAHFPHAMEKIYSCWSFWEANSGKHPVIVGPPGYKGFVPSSTPQFVEEMLQAMHGAFNVTVTTTDQLNDTDVNSAVDPNYPRREFHIFRDDAWKWTEGILRHEKVERVGCKGPIRIGILNRSGSRSILNAEHIRDEVLRYWGSQVEMDVTTFDAKSFREQIAWFATHDIIFTGHGAQETGMPFMPKCGALIEIFPVGYYIPHYFGTLSDSCHVNHYTVYGNQSSDPHADTRTMSATYEQRGKLRATNFCPATGTILRYFLQVVSDWVSCCESENHD